MKKTVLLLLLPFISLAQEKNIWRITVNGIDNQIPIHILLENSGSEVKAYSVNADEKFAFDRAFWVNDTLHLRMDLYDLEMALVPKGKTLKGYLSKPDANMMYRQAQFTGTLNDTIRFKNPKNLKPLLLSKKYQVTFKNINTGKESPAIGVFETKEGRVKGTFLTNTGDYRYLQGNVIGDSLFLSALGMNVYLYKAKIKGDSLVNGTVHTPFGATPSTFSGVVNADFQLDDPSKLTYLKKGYDKFDFKFKEINGNEVSLSDPRFFNKVTVVQILGTWCPNCLDETKFLVEYKKSNPFIEVVGLSFEVKTDPQFAYPKIARLIERYGVNYPILLAGTTAEAQEKLPQLNHIMAFPTSLIIDKKGVVRKIHTGFNGPGTGIYYEEYVKEFSDFIDKLQAE